MGGNELQIISEGVIISIIGSLLGLIIVVVGSYAVFIIHTIKKNFDQQREDFRDYKRDTALAIQQLYDFKNELMSRLDRIEVAFNDLKEKCERNHDR